MIEPETKPILYTSAGSRGLRVSWIAAELGVELDYRMLPFPPRTLAREYLDVNPLGTVPALLVNGCLMTESCGITEYLAGRFGAGTLAVSPDEADYPAYLDFLHHADATVTFPQTVYLRFVKFEPELGLQAAGEAYADWFAKRLRKTEFRLETREFLCSGRFSAADVAVGYALYLSRLNGLHTHLTPILADYLDRLTARPAFARAIATEEAAAASQGVTSPGKG